MPSRFRGHCLDCGHAWDGLRWSINCGPVDIQDPDAYRCYCCPRCWVDLYVARRLSRSSWLRWVAENASEVTRAPLVFQSCELGVRVDLQALEVIARSPLLFRACERVSVILAGASSRYARVPIDIGTTACPDCGDPMSIGCLATNPLICPKCKRPSARSISEHSDETVLMDYFPLKNDEVRRVIRHLRDLAERPKDHRSDRKLALACSEGRDALWDRDLDG